MRGLQREDTGNSESRINRVGCYLLLSCAVEQSRKNLSRIEQAGAFNNHLYYLTIITS